MGKVYTGLDDRLSQFIVAQPVFFVATAPSWTDAPDGGHGAAGNGGGAAAGNGDGAAAAGPADGGHVNVSPKGYRDTFAILGPTTVAYLDLTGSGAETIAHLRQNGRITIMFCSFTETPKILRLYGTGRVVLPGDPEWAALAGHFPALARTGSNGSGASADGASADGASADVASADVASADGASADGASADGASADVASADGASADGASADGASADVASADGAGDSGAEAGGDEAGADGANGNGASADGASADGASADGASADGASADGVSAGGASADGTGAEGASADVAGDSGAEGGGHRSIIVAELDRVADSCGYAVPVMELREERDLLTRWAERKTPAQLAAYRAEKNEVSIDGLPALGRDEMAKH